MTKLVKVKLRYGLWNTCDAAIEHQSRALTGFVHQQLSMVRGKWFVLNYLKVHETAVHPKELSEKMSVSTARIASLLNYLAEQNLIIRKENPQDNRQVIVKLTPDGVNEIEEIRKKVISQIKMLEALGLDDTQAYV